MDTSQRSDSADAASIKSLEANFIAAFRAKNIPQIMSFFAPGNKLFVFDLATPRQHAGHDAFMKDWEDGFLKKIDGPLSVEMSDLDLATNGSNLAFSHSVVHVSGKQIGGGAIDHISRVTHVYEKLNGKWLIVHEHVSVPIDMAAGKPDFQSKVS
jgi:ketosteroid isomerase-like protein